MSNPEVSCRNCSAACCKGNPFLMMQLSEDELSFMRKSGNVFQTIVEPAAHEQVDARYPIGGEINPRKRTVSWLYERGHETEPLPAGMGRYALAGACKNLITDENGWEHCGVYDNRPEVCRDFEMGSPKCVVLRSIADIETGV